jgi:hypothetical protein
MFKRLQPVLAPVGYIVFWLGLAVLATLTAFQIHGTLIAISLAVIDNPVLRPTGWSTDTVYALSRVFWLVIGILWLGWVMFTEGYLREGYQLQLLKHRTLRLIIVLGVAYVASYIILFLLQT